MFYPKNVPNIERALRITVGLILIALSLFGQPLLGPLSPLAVGFLWFNAAFVIVTGFVGWCPACALIGRKIKANPQHQTESR